MNRPQLFLQQALEQPQQQGADRRLVGGRPTVIGQEAEEAQQSPHQPPDEEVTTTPVEESSTPATPRSQMAVATSLVKKAWYSKNSELVVSRTK